MRVASFPTQPLHAPPGKHMSDSTDGEQIEPLGRRSLIGPSRLLKKRKSLIVCCCCLMQMD